MSPSVHIVLSLVFAQLMVPATALPSFDIDLDAPPEKRWVKVASHYKTHMVAMAKAAMPQLLPRAPWAWLNTVRFDPEHVAEMQGMVDAVNDPDVTLDTVKTINMLYEMESPTACSGVLWAMPNGTVMQGRNMDYSLKFEMPDGKSMNWQDVTFNAIFHKAGKPLFQTTQWPFMIGVHTGMRYGGWSLQQNTRKGLNDWHKNFAAAKKGGQLFLIVTRKVMETTPHFKDAVSKLTDAKFMAPMYFVMSGTGPFEGVVITVDRLGKHAISSPPTKQVNNEDLGWHAVQTNDDQGSDTDDIRRPLAEYMLGGTTQDIISLDHLMQFMHTTPLFWNGTVFSTVMVPAFDYYQTTLPNEGSPISEALFNRESPVKLEAKFVKILEGEAGLSRIEKARKAGLIQKHSFLAPRA